jgi:hypothetical protein
VSGDLLQGMREIGRYRTLLAVGIPFPGGALMVASSVRMPRGKAKGLISGAYMLLASLGTACLLCAAFAAIGGEPSRVVLPLLLPGVLLTVINGDLFARSHP